MLLRIHYINLLDDFIRVYTLGVIASSVGTLGVVVPHETLGSEVALERRSFFVISETPVFRSTQLIICLPFSESSMSMHLSASVQLVSVLATAPTQ